MKEIFHEARDLLKTINPNCKQFQDIWTSSRVQSNMIPKGEEDPENEQDHNVIEEKIKLVMEGNL